MSLSGGAGAPRTVLVTGATGTVGSRVVAGLAAGAGSGVRVRAGSRRPPAPAPGVEPVHLELGDESSLRRALAGVEAAFLLTPLGPEMPERVERFARAAREAGVRRVTRLSAYGAGDERPRTRLAAVHAEAEAALRAAGLECTFLRPNAFMDNLVVQHGAALRAEGVLRAPQGDGAVSLVDGRDVAEVAIATLLEPGHRGRAYELTGPEALDNHEVARRLGRALGASIRYEDVPAAAAGEAMLAAGLDRWLVDLVLELYALSAAGGAARVSPDVARVLGRPARGLDPFLREHGERLRPAGAQRSRGSRGSPDR